MIFLGLEGHTDSAGRDLTIDAMKAAAEHLSSTYGVEVRAVRYDDGPWITDAFLVRPDQAKPGAELGEVTGRRIVPVRRRRRHLGRRWVGPWQDLRSVPAAAHDVGVWLRDLRQAGRG